MPAWVAPCMGTTTGQEDIDRSEWGGSQTPEGNMDSWGIS